LGLLCKKNFFLRLGGSLVNKGLGMVNPYKGYELTWYTLIIQLLISIQSRTSPAFAFDLALNT
jgi:hypothetical protein